MARADGASEVSSMTADADIPEKKNASACRSRAATGRMI